MKNNEQAYKEFQFYLNEIFMWSVATAPLDKIINYMFNLNLIKDIIVLFQKAETKFILKRYQKNPKCRSVVISWNNLEIRPMCEKKLEDICF